jgi:predicted ATPase
MSMVPEPEREPRPSTAAPRWQVRLLGAVQASDGLQTIERFPSRAGAALLARLALAPGRAHAREELIELLWPGVALDVGRNRLRQALSALKSLLEPAGVAGAEVIRADRARVWALDGALGCDAVAFEHAARAGQRETAAALYRGELMPGFYDEWIDAERQRLKTLRERIGEPLPAPLGPHLIPLPAAAAPPLPVYLSRLFGAEHAAARLRDEVQRHRLVTLLGPGGSGKTRLAVEVAQSLRVAASRFDRVAFVALASCNDSASLFAAAARALRVPPGADGSEAIVAALASTRVLLVLDNFEQLVDAAAADVGGWLQRLPALHLLATSRRPLGIDGEQLVAAEPLALPEAGAPLAAAAAAPAVALFVDRARAARADFHLHAGNAVDVVALVRALEGMPLAIELAASRVRSVAPGELAARLVRRPGAASSALPLLARSGGRGHERRHASMEQVIDWSWQQLDDDARRALGALAVFHLAPTAPAVAAVLGDDTAATALQLDALVAHSLVRALAGDGGEPRFGLYEPVREFVAARLAPAEARALRSRLRQRLVAWARTRPAHVADELPEIQAAIASAVADGAPQQALEIALALRAYWDTDGMPGHAVRALAHALAAADGQIDAAQRADMHELLAYLCFETGSAADALQHADAAVAAAGSDASRRARALVRRAWVEIATSRSAGAHGLDRSALLARLDEAQTLARGCGDREALARALHQAAVIASHLDADHVRAEALLEQSQALWLALGDRRKAYARLRNRAQCWASLGRVDEAMASYRACEQAAIDDRDWVGLIDNLLSIGVLLAGRRAWAESLAAFQRAVALCWQRWHRHGLAYALWNPPRLLARLRRPEAAMRLLAFAVGLWTSGFGPLTAADRHYVRLVRRLVRAQIGAARAEVLWIEGSAMALPDAVALALDD